MTTRPRRSAARMGYDQAWRKVRLAILRRDRWICQLCGKRGNTVDHVVPLRERPDLRLSPANLRTTCRSCNLRLAREREQRDGVARPWAHNHRETPRIWRGAIDERETI
jgi:5-methylcytosine-specific restriction enzyme A